MPSRQLSSPPSSTPSSPKQIHQSNYLIQPLLASTVSICSLFLLITLCCFKVTRKRPTPSTDPDSKPPYRFSFSILRRSTSNFFTRIGHGGFGPVFSGALPRTRQSIAVKLMDTASLQGEREFHNELFFASRLHSQYVVSAIGFCSDRKPPRFLLVYDLMPNGNLQDALLSRKCPELMEWKKRFSVIVDIANGIQYLHSCGPPVIHGDIKPSNILLDRYFSAKIGDFGLARLKSEKELEVGVSGIGDFGKENVGLDSDINKQRDVECNGGVRNDDCDSVAEGIECANTGFDESIVWVEQSSEGVVRIPISETSSETIEAETASPETATVVESASEGTLDRVSVEGEKEIKGRNKSRIGGKSCLRKDWWWKQDDDAAVSAENKMVKDYVMQWIGTEITIEGSKRDYGAPASANTEIAISKVDKKKNRKRLEWWMSMDMERTMGLTKKQKCEQSREWWKEEYIEERSRKKKKKKRQHKIGNHDLYVKKKDKMKSLSRGRHSGIDWWLEGVSGELPRARWNSYNSGSGEIPKIDAVSSTPSMRGTVCYGAPECCYPGDVSEKCDVYSFGVLLLVVVSGRRPLQVTDSPLSEFHRANLVSWARHCAHRGKLLELVDQSIQSLDAEQASLCITVALLCLQKSPSHRPSMNDVVGMLTGDLQRPQLPVGLLSSATSHFPF